VRCRRFLGSFTEAVMEQLMWKQLIGEQRELKREKEAGYIKLVVIFLGIEALLCNSS